MALYMLLSHHQLTLAHAEAGEGVLVLTGVYRSVAGFFALMVAYAIFIPNTWQRALTVVLPMAILPAALFVSSSPRHTVVGRAVADLRSPEHPLSPASFCWRVSLSSVYGAHTLHTMRRAATAARQMGMYKRRREVGGRGAWGKSGSPSTACSRGPPQ